MECFTGFTEDDFAVFTLPKFAERMPLLKERITPKLKRIGEALTAPLSAALGETLYPHVAQHLRRSVNPPVETWVAFAREKRAYKPFVHLRAGISREKVRVTVFVEDYADDKMLFADNLSARADALAAHVARHKTVTAYEIPGPDGKPLRGKAITGDALRQFAERMRRVKGQHAIFGVPFVHTDKIVADGEALQDAIVKTAVLLKPFYDCGLAK